MQGLSSLSSAVKKRRRCGLRFSSTKQLRRARIEKKRASMSEVDAGNAARVLSINSEENKMAVSGESDGSLETIHEQPTISSYVSEQMHTDFDNELLNIRDEEQSRRVSEVSSCHYVCTLWWFIGKV